MQRNKTPHILIPLYVLFGALELVSIQFEISLLHHITKPLLMPILIVYYWVLSSGNKIQTIELLIVALIFSWLGDVFLMYQNHEPLYFMLGLGSFLIAHILYIILYVKLSNKAQQIEKTMRPRLARYDFFILLIWLSLIITLYPVLGEMKIPVIIYSITITGMALTALHRYQRTSPKSFWMVLLGALAFMLSDSLIAINKFLSPILVADILIMVTYLIAQYLILSGIIAHQKDLK